MPEYRRSIPLHRGMSPAQSPLERGFLLNVSDAIAVRYRRVYGYIGEIKFLPDGDNELITHETPALRHIVVYLWWGY